jgi:hypothetical protein
MIKHFLNRLFCKHDYQYESEHLFCGGMKKAVICRCSKCGKEKWLYLS